LALLGQEWDFVQDLRAYCFEPKAHWAVQKARPVRPDEVEVPGLGPMVLPREVQQAECQILLKILTGGPVALMLQEQQGLA
jgi:hypothetical protein